MFMTVATFLTKIFGGQTKGQFRISDCYISRIHHKGKNIKKWPTVPVTFLFKDTRTILLINLNVEYYFVVVGT